MDFGSFENTIDKNIETEKASDKFDQQQKNKSHQAAYLHK